MVPPSVGVAGSRVGQRVEEPDAGAGEEVDGVAVVEPDDAQGSAQDRTTPVQPRRFDQSHEGAGDDDSPELSAPHGWSLS